MNYDFDIHWILSKEIFADEKLGGFLTEMGMAPDTRGNYRAMFRDQRTIDALQGASEPVKAFFKKSGFGMVRYDSGAPSGFYPAADEDARNDVIMRLAENLRATNLNGEDMNGIDFSAFLAQIARARPILSPTPEAALQPAATPPLAAAQETAKTLPVKGTKTARKLAIALLVYLALWQVTKQLDVFGTTGLVSMPAASDSL